MNIIVVFFPLIMEVICKRVYVEKMLIEGKNGATLAPKWFSVLLIFFLNLAKIVKMGLKFKMGCPSLNVQ